MEEKPEVVELENTVETEELDDISKELDKMVSSGDQGGYDSASSASSSSSRGESAPQPYKQSIADMEEQQQQPTITYKELKALKRARYDKIAEKFQYAYVLRNKRTGLVVEIRAASSFHACNIIGWKPRHVRLVEVIDTKKRDATETTETTETTPVETKEALEV